MEVIKNRDLFEGGDKDDDLDATAEANNGPEGIHDLDNSQQLGNALFGASKTDSNFFTMQQRQHANTVGRKKTVHFHVEEVEVIDNHLRGELDMDVGRGSSLRPSSAQASALSGVRRDNLNWSLNARRALVSQGSQRKQPGSRQSIKEQESAA